MSKDKDVIRAVAQSVMLSLGCAPFVSQGMCRGQTFCSNHGTANDVAWGWSPKHGCMFVYDVVKSAREGDAATLTKMLNWVKSS